MRTGKPRLRHIKRMKIDLRILAAVSVFMAMAASAIVIVRYSNGVNPVYLVEVIQPKGTVAAEDLPTGLQLQISDKGLTLSVPDCDISAYQDRFFLHLYTKYHSAAKPEPYVNLDFNLAQETGKETITGGIKKCVYHKNFADFSVKHATLGQFTLPNGRCCEITWSRSFVFDERMFDAK